MTRFLRAAGTAGALVFALAAAPSALGAPPGVQHLHYRAGPFAIHPGQNSIRFGGAPKPKVDGYIVGITPNLRYTRTGKVPRVDVVHLHHGVWINLAARRARGAFGNAELFFAAGEEKTRLRLPRGFGYEYHASDPWVLNYMIHNLTPHPTSVYLTYNIDFVPASSPLAKRLRPARPLWMDVERGKIYPVFDVHRFSGRHGRFTFPNDARNPYPGGRRRNEWKVDRDSLLIGTGGHLHPGGLHTDLWLKRPGAKARRAHCSGLHSARARRSCRRRAPSVRGNTAHLFRSSAHYYEPAGAVSWDVSMTVTRPGWRVLAKRGDTLKVTATYDTRRGSWYESMGIMIVWMADAKKGPNPFRRKVDFPGRVTHGHLPENNHHGGKPTSLPVAARLPSGVFAPGVVGISDFRYLYGDLRLSGVRGRPPVVRPGQSLLFSNGDNAHAIYHSITSCRAPCRRSTGIAYPIADGRFDSGQLGDRTPAVGRTTWRTPANLTPGTYSYFCRIHPFMRGAFRVKK